MCAKILEIPPINLLSLSAIKISGAPNIANQFEITASRTISAVCSPRFFVPKSLLPKNEKMYLGYVRKLHDPHSQQKSISTNSMKVFAIGIFDTLPNIRSFLNSSFYLFQQKS